MKTIKVKPDNGAREGRFLALAIIAILALGFMSIPHHQAHSALAQVGANQIAVEQLPKTQLGPLRELNIANEELQFYQQDEQRWPDVAELANEFIAPFSNDAWHWQMVEAGVYLGTNGSTNSSANTISSPDPWSLLLQADSGQIWYLNAVHGDYHAPLTEFIEHDWQQVLFTRASANAHGDKH